MLLYITKAKNDYCIYNKDGVKLRNRLCENTLRLFFGSGFNNGHVNGRCGVDRIVFLNI